VVLESHSLSIAREQTRLEFALEVYPPTGQAFRATATYRFRRAGRRFRRTERRPLVGAVVNVRYHPTTLKVALDLHQDPRYSACTSSPHARSTPLAADTLFTLRDHTSAVFAVAWSPDGSLLASGSADNTLRIWNRANGQRLATLAAPPEESGVRRVAWSPDGRLVAFCGWHTHLWDSITGERFPPLIAPGKVPASAPVNSVAWSPYGDSLATGDDLGLICLWDARTRTPLATLQGHTDAISSVAWSPDGRLLVSASQDQTVRLWEVSTGQTLTTLPAEIGFKHLVAWSPDGRLLACGGAKAPRIWDTSIGNHRIYLWRLHDIILAPAWSPDGRLLAAVIPDQHIMLWDVSEGQSLFSLSEHPRAITSLAWSPDGLLLAAGLADKMVHIWRMSLFGTRS
jgi:WD40 repeat protein